MEPSAPRKINKYDVIDLIGRGGMGVVYKAVDRSLDRLVAIKMVTSADDPRGDLLKRFYRESQFTANLRHQNIVTVYELGDFEGRPYLVMEYLAGQSLDSILARQPMTLQQRINYIRQVCHGLHYAHSRQPSIIHRDIKPANIVILEDGTAKIVDFGIARLGQSNDTRSGQLMGSYHYMSPEQIESAELDGRSDIFSVGVVLYQLLTLTLPFEGNGIAQTLHRIINSPPPPLTQFLKEYPPALDEIIFRALAKNREDRYQSAAELSFDLMQVEGDLLRGFFAGFIERAENLLRQGDFESAKQELVHVLDIDHQHTRANDLMREVQQGIMRQQRQRRARDLRSHAEEALERNHLDEALGFLEQAIGLDQTDTGLQTFREQVRELKARADKLNELLERAERLVSAHELDGAACAVAEAIEFEPNSARAKAFKLIIDAKLLERERNRQVQELLSLARQHIGGGEFEPGLELLKKVEGLDPTVSGLRDLMAVAEAGRRSTQRHSLLEKAAAGIKKALSRHDTALAQDLIASALEKFPGERSLLDLKLAAEEQLEVRSRDRAEEGSIHLVSGTPSRDVPSTSVSSRSNSVPNVQPVPPGAGALRKPRPQDQAVAELTPLHGIDYSETPPKPATAPEPSRSAASLGIPPETMTFPLDRGRTAPLQEGQPLEAERKANAEPAALPLANDWPPELLRTTEQRLAAFLGPLARVVVKRAAARAKDLDEFYNLVAEKIERPKDRDAFLAAKPLTPKSSSPPAGSRSRSPEATAPEQGRAELTPQQIENAKRALARYVGPSPACLPRERPSRRIAWTLFTASSPITSAQKPNAHVFYGRPVRVTDSNLARQPNRLLMTAGVRASKIPVGC